jgi:hypothetical protein
MGSLQLLDGVLLRPHNILQLSNSLLPHSPLLDLLHPLQIPLHACSLALLFQHLIFPLQLASLTDPFSSFHLCIVCLPITESIDLFFQLGDIFYLATKGGFLFIDIAHQRFFLFD